MTGPRLGGNQPETSLPLTPKMRAVARLAALGYTYRGIAAELGNTECSVKNLAYRSYRRAGVECMADLWRALGWLTVPAVADAMPPGGDRTRVALSPEAEPSATARRLS